MFTEKDLFYLDPAEETDEEYHEYQHRVHHRHEPDEDDSVNEGDFPNRAEFHSKSVSRELRKRASETSKELSKEALPEP